MRLNISGPVVDSGTGGTGWARVVFLYPCHAEPVKTPLSTSGTGGTGKIAKTFYNAQAHAIVLFLSCDTCATSENQYSPRSPWHGYVFPILCHLCQQNADFLPPFLKIIGLPPKGKKDRPSGPSFLVAHPGSGSAKKGWL